MVRLRPLRFLSSLAFNETTHFPSAPNLPSLLSQCSTLKHIAQIHAFMICRGLDQDNLLLSDFINASSQLGFTHYSLLLFQRKERPDLYLCNTAVRCLSRSDSAKNSIFIFIRIQAMGYRPDTYSFPLVLKAVAHLSALELGREVHCQIIRTGLVLNVHISTALIHMYSACRDVNCARMVFDEIPHRDVVVWNAMVAGYVKIGDVDNARGLFERMPDRNVISWTTMIAGYAQLNCPGEAIVVFRRMQLEDSIEPDEIALLAALSACAQLGALDLGEWIHRLIDKRRLHKVVSLMNALMDMYAKSGNIEKALEVFECMERRSVVTWTTMIAGFASHGRGVEALELFRRMERSNVQPNDVTFVAILSACSHIGLIDLGRWCFNRMSSRYLIKPRIEHYGCMVDLFGRVGFLREACDLIRDMPFEPNGAIWGSLLAAARIHGDMGIGEHALRHLIEVEPNNGGNYTLLSNIYASHQKWDSVGKLRKLMKNSGVKKIPGGSSIVVDGRVHEFTCRDGAHPGFKRIYEVLHEINGYLKMVGYVPTLCGGLLDVEDG